MISKTLTSLKQQREQGFTMIELLISISIIGILASLALTSFSIYRENAEYTKAESDLRNSRVAMEAGTQDISGAFSLALSYSGTAGGNVPAPLDSVMPQAVTSSDVRLGVAYDSCPVGAGAGAVEQYIISSSCKGRKSVSWTRFCDGMEVTIPELPFGCV